MKEKLFLCVYYIVWYCFIMIRILCVTGPLNFMIKCRTGVFQSIIETCGWFGDGLLKSIIVSDNIFLLLLDVEFYLLLFSTWLFINQYFVFNKFQWVQWGGLNFFLMLSFIALIYFFFVFFHYCFNAKNLRELQKKKWPMDVEYNNWLALCNTWIEQYHSNCITFRFWQKEKKKKNKTK